MRTQTRVMLPVIPQRPTDDIERTRAACLEANPELFYSDHPGDKLVAKGICSGCDIRIECLRFALGLDDRYGVWGGLAAEEREPLRKRKQRVGAA